MLPSTETLASIRQLHGQIDNLLELLGAGAIDDDAYRRRFAEIDAILTPIMEPICRDAIRQSDADLSALIDTLPSGFYRTELRTILLTRSRPAG